MELRALEPNVITYHAAISACEGESYWEGSLHLFDEMENRGLKRNVVSYGALMAAIDWQRGLLLLKELREESLEANDMISVSLIDAMARDAQWSRALQSLGTSPAPVLFNAALNACAAGRQWQVALNLVQQMRAVAMDVDAVSLRTAMSAYLGT